MYANYPVHSLVSYIDDVRNIYNAVVSSSIYIKYYITLIVKILFVYSISSIYLISILEY